MCSILAVRIQLRSCPVGYTQTPQTLILKLICLMSKLYIYNLLKKILNSSINEFAAGFNCSANKRTEFSRKIWKLSVFIEKKKYWILSFCDLTIQYTRH